MIPFSKPLAPFPFRGARRDHPTRPPEASKTPHPRATTTSALLFLVALMAALGGLPRQGAAGTIVSATCSCGYTRAHLGLFGGKSNFETVCMFPGLCQETGELVLYNALAPMAGTKECPHGRILSYDDPFLAPKTLGKTITSWNIPKRNKVFVIYDSGYYCPRCRLKNLHFSLDGMYD